jgi:D-alanine-D-alanine ligase
MHVVFLYNESAEDPALAAEETDPIRSPVVAALRRLGHDVTPIACTLDLAAARRELRHAKPDVVLNRVESLGGSDAMMGAVPLLLDTMQIPYTGCSGDALAATASKLAVKERLARAGLPTPGWITADSRCHGDVDWPHRPSSNEHRASSIQHPASSIQHRASSIKFILKSVYEHASYEIDDSAVIKADLLTTVTQALVKREAETGRPFFAEQFIAGREFNLSVWGDEPQVLPPAEIDFSAFPKGKPHIVAHRAKWDAASFEFHHTPRRFDFPAADAPLLRRPNDLTIDCSRLFNLLGGYARVDFRCDGDGQPWILEINSNPCLSPNAGFAAAFDRAGFEYDAAIQQLLDQAMTRSPRASGQKCARRSILPATMTISATPA